MDRFLNWLLGTVTVLVSGAQPEDFLNLCAKKGLVLQRMVSVDPFTLEVQVKASRYRRLCRLAEKVQCTVQVKDRRGLAFFLWGFRRRYALLAGIFFCLLVTAVGSRVILTVDVTGNRDVTAEEIISQLRLCGVSAGTWGPSVPIRAVENKVMMAMDELSFFSLNLSGTRAEVIVREKGRPAPEARQEEVPTNVVSAADGIVTHIEPWRGDAQYVEGDPVQKGDILIAGRIRLDAPSNVEAELGTWLVHAEGRVMARTWRTLTAQLDLSAPVKEYTGREKTRWTLSILGKGMKISENSGVPYEKYDIMTQLQSWTPVAGKTLPMVWGTETFREYTITHQLIDPARGEELLRAELLETLTASLDEGEILKTDFTVSREGDLLTVKLVAQCSEQIGRLAEMDTDEKVMPPTHRDETDTKEQSP